MLGRVGKSAGVASVVAFLDCGQPNFITGQDIKIEAFRRKIRKPGNQAKGQRKAGSAPGEVAWEIRTAR